MNWLKSYFLSSPLPYLGLAGTSLFWAGNALVARDVYDAIPPMAFSFYRWLLCAILLSPFIIRAFIRHKKLIRDNWLKLGTLALLSVASFNSLLYLSAQYTTALNITLVNSLMPVATILLAAPILKLHMTLSALVGVAVAFSGALYVILRGNLAALLMIDINVGDCIMALGMLSWSLYSVLLTRWPLSLSNIDLFSILLGLGIIMIFPFYILEYTIAGNFEWTDRVATAVIYVAVFPSLCAYLLWNYGVAKTSPSTAALFSYLTPLFTALLAIPYLGEHPEAHHYVGGGAILFGLLLSRRKKKKQISEKPQKLSNNATE